MIFSKWSRKNYAVFSGLKKVIHIARLSVDICRVLLMKCVDVLVEQSDLINEHAEKEGEMEQLEQTNILSWSVVTMPTDLAGMDKKIIGDRKPVSCIM